MGKIISTAYLMGGLGNQMFQIAHAISQAYKQNIDCVFKPEAYTPMQANQPSKYLNNIYRNVLFSENIGEKVVRMHEATWNNSRVNPKWDTSIEFYGYFQSSKNFLGNDKAIIDLFAPTIDFLNKVKKKYPQILEENTISIHIRRGDYLQISDVMPVLDKSYFDYCLEQMKEYSTVFIFSDDIEWVENNLDYKRSIIVKNLEDYEEMWLMSLCKNNVMSNSSFSWWGSFLNKNKNKTVFVPSIWFGPKGPKSFYNIYEAEWNKINVKYSNGRLLHSKSKSFFKLFSK